MRCLFYLLIIGFIVTSCGDSNSKYITSINNNTGSKIVVHLFEDSTIVCLAHQETIIEESWGGSVTEMTCMTPYIFKSKEAEIIIDGGAKILTKDIYDDNNWSCKGVEDWSLIMVGSYYSQITKTFTVNDEDIEDTE